MNEFVSTTTTDGVFVGTDGSPGSRAAALWAARWARAHGCPVRVVRVVSRYPVPTRAAAHLALGHGSEWPQYVWGRAEDALNAVVEEVRVEAPDVRVEAGLIKAYSAAEELIRLSAEARLVVVGATGSSGVSRSLVGGTAAAVIHHSRCPVAIVPLSHATPDGPIVVALDDADVSHAIGAFAVREAQAFGRRLVAVHAWSLPDGWPAGLEEAEVNGTYRELLSQYTSPADQVGVEVELVVRQGRPVDVLTELSRTASMLVMGTRGRGGFAGLLLGSVSRGVVLRASCPLLVLRTSPDRPPAG